PSMRRATAAPTSFRSRKFSAKTSFTRAKRGSAVPWISGVAPMEPVYTDRDRPGKRSGRPPATACAQTAVWVRLPDHADRAHPGAGAASPGAPGVFRRPRHAGVPGRARDVRGRRPAVPRGPPADGEGRLARHRVAQGVRRAGPDADRAVPLLRRGDV